MRRTSFSALVPVLAVLFFVAAVLGVRAEGSEVLRVVATTPDLAAIVRAVGGDRVEVTSLARPGEDVHFVDPKPSFVVALNQADLLIEGGAALESGWLPPLLDAARNPRLALDQPGRAVAAQGIPLLDVPAALDRSMGDVHPHGNPHYLLDPVNAVAVADTVAGALCGIDAGDCAGYRDGARAFRGAIEAKLPEWQAALAKARDMKVVSYHRNFDYFTRRFGLVVIDTIEPKPGIPPSPAHLAELIPKMKANDVRLILVEPNRERQNPDFVAEQAGARVVVLPTMPGVAGTVDYVGLIDYDVRQLASAVDEP